MIHARAFGLIACLLSLVCCASATTSAIASASTAAPGPPSRIVSLSPHITELLFAVGAGGKIVGVDAFSDYPDAARKITRVADVFAIDVERLLTVRPDLVIYWTSGTPARQQEQLKTLGLRLFGTEQRHLDDIGRSLIDFGRLTGNDVGGQRAAAAYEADLNTLRARYAGRPRLTVFYQVWDRPLYTLSGAHVVTEALNLCGADNVFSELRTLAPVVETEAVLARNPDVIIIAATGAEGERQMRNWRSYAGLGAVRTQRIYTLSPDFMNRMTPRILKGIDQLCRTLDQARLRTAPAAGARREAERSRVARR